MKRVSSRRPRKAKSARRPQFVVGDLVTCRYSVGAYYSGYGGNPKMVFQPGMIGTVKAITPKVRIVGDAPEHDGKPYFLVVDYDCPDTNKTQRVGLNFCNARRIKESKRG